MFNTIKGSEPMDLRNRCMLEFLYGSGLRISELLNLTPKNIHIHSKEINIIGKGNKERIVPLSDMAIDAFNKWMSKGKIHFKTKPGNYLFINKGRYLPYNSASCLLNVRPRRPTNLLSLSKCGIVICAPPG